LESLLDSLYQKGLTDQAPLELVRGIKENGKEIDAIMNEIEVILNEKEIS